MNIRQTAKQAQKASIRLGAVSSEVKNQALADIAKALKARSAEIVSANQADLARAEKENLAAPLLKRLKFDEAKINEACDGL